MENFIRILLVVSLTVSIIAKPFPHGFDDEGEISVPRSPKIQGDSIINQPYSNTSEVEDLRCDIEGSPTPSVLWLKDNQEINNDGLLYNITYDVTDGKAELKFTDIAKSDKQHVAGNFTCIAVNFLGKVQKIYMIQVAESDATTTPNSDSTTESLQVQTTIVSGDSSTQVVHTSSTTSAFEIKKILSTPST